MGKFETQETFLTVAQKERTMQNHMRGNSGDQASGFDSIQEDYINRVMSDFVSIVLESAFNEYMEQDRLRKYYEEYKSDIVSVFSDINEDVLNDPEYSQDLITGKEYKKKIGSKISFLSFSPVRKLKMDLEYVPGIRADEPNKMRLTAREELTEEEYPCNHISIEIRDDGTINMNAPRRMENKDSEEPINFNDTQIPMNEAIYSSQEVFMDLFESSGIKSTEENKSFSN